MVGSWRRRCDVGQVHENHNQQGINQAALGAKLQYHIKAQTTAQNKPKNTHSKKGKLLQAS